VILFYKKSLIEDSDHEDFYLDDLKSNYLKFNRVLLASTSKYLFFFTVDIEGTV
jgi:hypothetical protein